MWVNSLLAATHLCHYHAVFSIDSAETNRNTHAGIKLYLQNVADQIQLPVLFATSGLHLEAYYPHVSLQGSGHHSL